jgi:hypothetical protein
VAAERSKTVVGFRGISNLLPALSSGGWALLPGMEKVMTFSDMKKLVVELENLLDVRGGSLDAPARDEFRARLDGLNKAIDEAEAAEAQRIGNDLIEFTAALLSVVTNVMALLK